MRILSHAAQRCVATASCRGGTTFVAARHFLQRRNLLSERSLDDACASFNHHQIRKHRFSTNRKSLLFERSLADACASIYHHQNKKHRFSTNGNHRPTLGQAVVLLTIGGFTCTGSASTNRSLYPFLSLLHFMQ